MTRTRGRKASRSVGRHRVKPNAKRKERKTQKRKSRNKVMRGGAEDDILLFYEPNVNPLKCVIIKERLTGRRDNLYLFFAADITLDEVKSYVCKAMGLDKEKVQFEPEFVTQKDDEKYSTGEPRNKLNNLFIKLSGLLSYSTIRSGYLKRDDKSIYKALVTSNEHIITSGLTPGSKINSWDVVVKNLGFEKGHVEYDKIYNDVSSRVAEDGYYTANNIHISAQKEATRAAYRDCVNKIHPNIRENVFDVKKRLANWPDIIKEAVPRMKKGGFTRKDAETAISDSLKANNTYSLPEKYDMDVNELRTGYTDTIDVFPDCKEALKSYFGLTNIKTIKEMFDEVYPPDNSS